MPPRAIRDEVERIRVLRMQHRLDRGEARRGDRRRCQPPVPVGVERMVPLQIGTGQATVQHPAIRCRIGHGRVGLQRHAPAQAVDEDPRHLGPFLRLAGLPLHDAGQDQRLARRGQGQVRRPLLPGFRQGLPHGPLRPAQQPSAVVAPLIGIGVRQHRPFLQGRHIAGQALGGVDEGGDLAGVQPLGDGEAALHRPRLAQHLQHLPQRAMCREEILPGPQRPLLPRGPGGQGEAALVPDRPGVP